ncbi:MAG: hypothetical protein Kow0040_11450 [Thermogutta sp.]
MPQADVFHPAGMPPIQPEPGFQRRLEFGDWLARALIAVGNWSTVYRAAPRTSPTTDTYVLKVLHPHLENDPLAVSLFRTEARIGRTVSHRHVVPILSEHVDDRPFYLVMPFLSGQTLDLKMPLGVAHPVVESLWIIRQAAEALEALWSAGWMHGDVKPSNLMISDAGHVTLLDLGFARRLDENTRGGGRPWVAGTINYLAPEWILGTTPPDIRSDIYSLGVILYQLLTGKRPYRAQSPGDLVRVHRDIRIPGPRTWAPWIGREVARLVSSMLSGDPLRRPQNPRELRDRLIRLEIDHLAERWT